MVAKHLTAPHRALSGQAGSGAGHSSAVCVSGRCQGSGRPDSGSGAGQQFQQGSGAGTGQRGRPDRQGALVINRPGPALTGQAWQSLYIVLIANMWKSLLYIAVALLRINRSI